MKSTGAFAGITTLIVLALVIAAPLIGGFAIVLPLFLVVEIGLLVYAWNIK